MTTFKSPGPGFKLYGIYHHHEYGGSSYLVWADHDPSEQEVVTACGVEFEPDRDEWIAVEVINEATIIQTASRER